MSYQLDLQKDGDLKPSIAMPPLPPEVPVVQEMVENQGEIQQDLVENVDNGAQEAPEDRCVWSGEF